MTAVVQGFIYLPGVQFVKVYYVGVNQTYFFLSCKGNKNHLGSTTNITEVCTLYVYLKCINFLKRKNVTMSILDPRSDQRVPVPRVVSSIEVCHLQMNQIAETWNESETTIQYNWLPVD